MDVVGAGAASGTTVAPCASAKRGSNGATQTAAATASLLLLGGAVLLAVACSAHAQRLRAARVERC